MAFSDLIPATAVSLTGQVVVCGFSTRNLDVVRDRCELHLHEKTGGVVVTRDKECTFISPTLIAHVDFDGAHIGRRVGQRGTDTETQIGTKFDPDADKVEWVNDLDLAPPETLHDAMQAQPSSSTDAVKGEKDAEKPLSREDEILAMVGHTVKAQDAKGRGRRKRT